MEWLFDKDAKWAGTVRHLLGGIGAFFVGMGWVTEESVADVITSFDGLLASLAFIVAWGSSLYGKWRGEQEA